MMAKSTKTKGTSKKRGKYDDKLQVKEGSFMDIINASMKHANDHSAKPAEKKKP
jgi:hypothetical protein